MTDHHRAGTTAASERDHRALEPQREQNSHELSHANQSPDMGIEIHPLAQLQRVVGNRHIARLLAEDEEVPSTRPDIGMAGGPVSNRLANRIYGRLGGGRPLAARVQDRMEATLGGLEGLYREALAEVRIHDDAEANALSLSVGASAFTLGNDIFFSTLADPADEAVLRHELTHVVQQKTMSQAGPLTVGPADNALEREAEWSAAQSTPHAAESHQVAEHNRQAPTIQRQTAMDEVHLAQLANVAPPGLSPTAPPPSMYTGPSISGAPARAGAGRSSGSGAGSGGTWLETAYSLASNLAGGASAYTGIATEAGKRAEDLTFLGRPFASGAGPRVEGLNNLLAPVGLATGLIGWYQSIDQALNAPTRGERVTGRTDALFNALGAFSGGVGTAALAGLSTAALAPAAAVAGAGAGGYAAGRFGDELFGGWPSRLVAGGMGRFDQWYSSSDSGEAPEYDQTLGWYLAEEWGL